MLIGPVQVPGHVTRTTRGCISGGGGGGGRSLFFYLFILLLLFFFIHYFHVLRHRRLAIGVRALAGLGQGHLACRSALRLYTATTDTRAYEMHTPERDPQPETNVLRHVRSVCSCCGCCCCCCCCTCRCCTSLTYAVVFISHRPLVNVSPLLCHNIIFYTCNNIKL